LKGGLAHDEDRRDVAENNGIAIIDVEIDIDDCNRRPAD